MHYGAIKDCDIANGFGVRVSVFVSGCTHHCKGCFQPKTWNFKYGNEWTEQTENDIVSLLARPFIRGLSLLGGEPFEPANQRVLMPFLKKVRALYPTKDIWCWSGYTYETDLLEQSRARCECTDEMLGLIDVLVDGEYVQSKHDVTLTFRGSSNQRVIDLKASRESGKTELLAGIRR